VIAGLAIATPIAAAPAQSDAPPSATVTIPDSDRFIAFSVTIHAGEAVRWVNTDTDDHTIVSDDAFNTTDHKGLNRVLVGTETTGGTPGVGMLKFNQPGTFVYYCRFHAHLDENNQPVAPGPDGGVETGGNFGTPMMGVVTVLP
jgi:plastocyanin